MLLLSMMVAHAAQGDGLDSGVYVAPGVEVSTFGVREIVRPGFRAAWVIEDRFSVVAHLGLASGPEVQYGDVGLGGEWTPLSDVVFHPDVEVALRLVNIEGKPSDQWFNGFAPWAAVRGELNASEAFRLSAGATVQTLAMDFDRTYGAGGKPWARVYGFEVVAKLGVF